jgi:hypothetical protein
LAGVDLSGGIFPKGVLLAGADMKQASIIDGYFNKPRFSGTKLNGARIERTNFFFGDFRGADLSSSSLKNLEFYGCDFSSATLSATQCENVKFIYCNFNKAEIYLGTETRSFTDTESSTRKGLFANTVFKACNFSNCLLNIPDDQLSPQTLVSCNLFKIRTGYGAVQWYGVKDHRNASVAKEKFFDWLDWLGQNRRGLADHNPEYEMFYKIDEARVRKEWTGGK